ncbi:MAG: DUF1015 domain-containing protein [Phycisphaerae bacterium]
MAVISPLAAIRYPQSQQSALVAPPYDVLTEKDKAHLLARNGHNVVAIDLPHLPPSQAGPDAAYAAAAHTLATWLEAGILMRDTKPALYAYQQTYTYAGVTYHRRGMFTRVRLEEFSTGQAAAGGGGTGGIHPHEQTFSGPKEDRLKLMRATKANLSPVFGLYDDPENDVTDLLFEAVGSTPALATAELPSMDGLSAVRSEIWAVTDHAVIQDITLMMADKDLYIADGHHRYTTCLNYRKELSEQRGVPLEHNDPANFALFVLIAMQDPGLIIMPTHRVVAAVGMESFYLERFVELAKKTCKIMETKLNGDSLAKLEKELPSFGPHAMGVYDPIGDQVIVIVPRDADPLAAFSDDPALAGKSASWRALDVAILQHLVFDRIVAPGFLAAGAKMSWAYPHEAHEVGKLCRGGQYRVGFILQPTPLTAVRDLCNAGELMPQKSTFFYPKLATGLVINPLT